MNSYPVRRSAWNDSLYIIGVHHKSSVGGHKISSSYDFISICETYFSSEKVAKIS